ncbi:hypothetical protein NUSPORA_02447 [Nucleospora cyclopteri]
MRKEEYEKLKELYEMYDEFIPEPNPLDLVYIDPTKFSFSKLKLHLTKNKYKKKDVVVKKPPTNNSIYNAIIRSIPSSHKIFMQNYTNMLAQQKKMAIVTSREAKRSLSKTSRTNPLLKSKKINKELQTSSKRAQRLSSSLQKSEERQQILEKKRLEEIEEGNRQKRKFNYLLNQTEAFANYFLNRTATNADLEGIKAAKKQMELLQKNYSEDEKKQEEKVEKSEMEVYVHKDIAQPISLNAKLRDYQLKGLNWLVSLYNQCINGILADDMGLGKTVQSIALLAYLYETKKIKGPFLVITPTSTLHNWINEFTTFLPTFKVIPYWGSVEERREARKNFKGTNVIITSYQLATCDEGFLKKIKFQYMILDEAQAIKSNISQRWKTLLNFKSRNRLLLTGTPIQNTMAELWTLLHFIMPTLFDSLSEFSDWFSKEIESNRIDEAQINRLHTILKPFMLRRHKSDIKDEIGTKEIVHVYCTLSNRQRALYDEIKASKMDYENIVMHLKKVCNHPDLFEALEPHCGLAEVVSGLGGFISFRGTNKKVLSNCLMHESNDFVCFQTKSVHKLERMVFRRDSENSEIHAMIQREKRFEMMKFRNMVFSKEKCRLSPITSDLTGYNPINTNLSNAKFVVVPPLNTFISDSGKLKTLDKLLIDLYNNKHRVLIYFQMTKMMDLFEDFLVQKEYNYLRLDGSSKISQRKQMVDQWQNSDKWFIFILSTRAGGVGINLTAADTVIFYDSDWNPTVDQQAMDRVHRLGQTKNVTVYKLITKNTIEERIMEMANKKDEMQKIVIKGDVFVG